MSVVLDKTFTGSRVEKEIVEQEKAGPFAAGTTATERL
jgi:hypothetical protein